MIDNQVCVRVVLCSWVMLCWAHMSGTCNTFYILLHDSSLWRQRPAGKGSVMSILFHSVRFNSQHCGSLFCLRPCTLFSFDDIHYTKSIFYRFNEL